MGFIKAIFKDLNDNDLGDLFLHLCKRLDTSSTNDPHSESLKGKSKLSIASNAKENTKQGKAQQLPIET